MRPTPKNLGCLLALWTFLTMGALVWASGLSLADDFTERRITTGAKIFRALLAADVGLPAKAGRDGRLRICLIYVDDATYAETASATLLNREDPRIQQREISVAITHYSDCVGGETQDCAAIFLTQPLSDRQLKDLMDCANRNNVVVFSPLEGDVARGVHGGIAIEARVRPYLNLDALRKADLRLKGFFIRVAKWHEE